MCPGPGIPVMCSLQDTEEVKAAKVRFGAAYADAEAGKVCCRWPFLTSLKV